MTNERLKAEIINSANSELLDEITNKLYNKAAPIPVTSFSPINNNTSNKNNSRIDLTSNYINYIYDSDDDDSEYLDLWSMEIPNTTNIDTPIAVPATNNNYITNRITHNTNNNNNNNRLFLNNQITTSNSHNSTSSNNRK